MNYQQIDIERAKSILSYNPDTGIFTRIAPAKGVRVGDIAGSKRSDGYIAVIVKGNRMLAHRLAWAMYYNEQTPAMIDHINCIPSDNRITNLRECNLSENGVNRRAGKNNTSGVKGVCFNKNRGKWIAQINKDKRYVYLGSFVDIEDAAKAYQEAAKIHHGEFMRLSA